ncbi:MAG: polysaccharide biosynthesis C-terminal domain-containing protein, partial [Clostridia bacterium]|nr:polysaccharide biosynthesis C-terminal domain-containing protein [Clostridia bacterium]
GVSFNTHVAVKVGEECMGLFTLVMSVYSFTVILASAGVNLAVVRRVSETVASCEKEKLDARRELRGILSSSLIYSLSFGTATGALLFALSEPVSCALLGDERCLMSVRVIAAGLPAVSVSSALTGYFTGVGRAYKNAALMIFEEFIKIAAVSYGLVMIAPRGIEFACLAIAGGAVISQAASAAISFIIYLYDVRCASRGAHKNAPADSERSVRRGIAATSALALPVAAGNVARHGFIAAEHLAIPRGLESYGMSESASLSVYGVLHGMVLPLVLFPSTVLYSAASLLIPEVAGCREVGNVERIKSIEEKVIRSTLLFSVCVAGVFLSFSGTIGTGLYHSIEASRQLSKIAVLIPVMYLDASIDAILKGLGEEVYCMKVNVADSALCLVLVFILVPKFGIDGYIILTIISEVINASFSIVRLVKLVPVKADIFRWIFCPVLSVCAATGAVKIASLFIPLSGIAAISLSVVLYGAACFASGAASAHDVRWISSLFKIKKKRRA